MQRSHGLLSAVFRGSPRRAARGGSRFCRPVPARVDDFSRRQIDFADRVVFGIGDVERRAVEGHALRLIEFGRGEIAVA